MYEDDYDAVVRLLDQLVRRKKRMPELLLSPGNCNAGVVPMEAFAVWTAKLRPMIQ